MRDLLIFLNQFKIILIPFFLIPLLLIGFGRARCYFKRLSLQGKIERFCEKNGFAVKWLRPPLFSMKTMDCKFDLVLKAGEKTYHVAILSARHRYREHLFASHDTLQINRSFRVKRAAQKTGRYRKAKKGSIELGVSTRSVPIELNVSVPADEWKILLFYPVAKEVTCFKGGQKRVLESGEEIYDSFYLFSLSAFFKQVRGEMNYIGKRKIWHYE